VLRFLIPLAPMLALIAGYGWAQGLNRPHWLRWTGRAVLGLLLLSNAALFFTVTDVFHPFRVPLGLQSRDAYLREKLTYYGAAEFINQTLPADARVLVIGDQRSYYYQRPTTPSTVFNQNPIVDWANGAGNPQALKDRLKLRWTHLVINHAEMRRLTPYRAFEFSPAGRKNWDQLRTRSTPIYTDAFCDVLAL
jgi:hypothetical protein